MRTTRLPIICVLVAATRCHYWWERGQGYLLPPGYLSSLKGPETRDTKPTPSPGERMTDRRLWKDYLPATTVADSNKLKFFVTVTESYVTSHNVKLILKTCLGWCNLVLLIVSRLNVSSHNCELFRVICTLIWLRDIYILTEPSSSSRILIHDLWQRLGLCNRFTVKGI